MILVGRSGIDKGGARGPARRLLPKLMSGEDCERIGEDWRGWKRTGEDGRG